MSEKEARVGFYAWQEIGYVPFNAKEFQCENCGKKFIAYEPITPMPLSVYCNDKCLEEYEKKAYGKDDNNI